MVLPRVKVLVSSGGNIGRDLLRGIAAWNRDHRAWILEPAPEHHDPDHLTQWSGHAIIAWAGSPNILSAVLARDLPRVLIGHTPTLPKSQRHPVVRAPGPDQMEATRLAVEHLLAIGCRHLAFCPHLDGQDFDRGRLFSIACQERGITPSRWNPPRQRQRRSHLLRWLKALPQQSGIWAVNDNLGLLLLEIARSEGIRVPDDLAVLGSDNDDLLCEAADPQLSSIASPNYATGYEAAASLNRVLTRTRGTSKALPPYHLVARASTERSAHADAAIAALLAQGERMGTANIGQITERIGVSRRTLERRCRDQLGRPPAKHLRSMRVALAQRILIDESATLDAIANRCGFSSVQRLHEAFRHETGMSPRAWQAAWCAR
jgi:LacI family transcriptional regulator